MRTSPSCTTWSKSACSFATDGRDHKTVEAFTQDLAEHGGRAQAIGHVSRDMSAAYPTGAQQQVPKAAICYDRFHVAALAGKAMDEVRAAAFKARPGVVASALEHAAPRCITHRC